MYQIGDKIYFQFNPFYEDDTWYPGTISNYDEETKCFEIVVKGYWRHFYIPISRLKMRKENLDELVVWKQLWEKAHYSSVFHP